MALAVKPKRIHFICSSYIVAKHVLMLVVCVDSRPKGAYPQFHGSMSVISILQMFI